MNPIWFPLKSNSFQNKPKIKGKKSTIKYILHIYQFRIKLSL